MAQSSIHIEQGHIGYLFHNTREKSTANSIFNDEQNEYNLSANEALKLYRTELQKRTEAYTQRTRQKLQKKVQTHLSAIVNLNKEHTLQDLQPLIQHLEQTLDTKVFQIAIHKDEGHLEGKKAVKNYHAHIEFLGLDSKGKSVRRKLTRKYLIELQTKTAELLKMQRGKNYTKQRAKRPKRLDTYEYKEHKKQEAKQLKILKKKLQKKPKQQEQQQGFIGKIFDKFAKQKDLKEQNKILREKLQKAGASRKQYATLEALNRDLKEQIKAKDLTISQLQKQMQDLQDKLLKQIQAEVENNELLTATNELFEKENKQLKQQLQMQPTPAEPQIVYKEKIVYKEAENNDKIEDLEQENDDLKKKNKELKEQLEAEQKAKKEAEAREAELQAQIEQLLAEGERLKKEVEQLKKDVAKLNKLKKSKKKGLHP